MAHDAAVRASANHAVANSCCLRVVGIDLACRSFLVAVCSIAGAKQLGGYRKKIIWLATKYKARFAHRPGKAPLYYTTDGTLHCTFAFPYKGHIQPFAGELGSWTEARKRRLYGGAAVTCSIEASTGFIIGNHVFCFHYEADEYDSDTADPSEVCVSSAQDAHGARGLNRLAFGAVRRDEPGP